MRELDDDLREPDDDMREPDDDMREPDDDMREPDYDMREPDDDMREPDDDMREPDDDVREPDNDLREPDDDMREPQNQNPKMSYNKWRDTKTPTAILSELCKINGIPSPEYRKLEVKVLNRIFKIPPDAVPEALLKKNERSPEEEDEMEEHAALSVLHRWGEMNEFLPGALPLVPEHVEIRSLKSHFKPGLPQVGWEPPTGNRLLGAAYWEPPTGNRLLGAAYWEPLTGNRLLGTTY
ncbi:Fer-1-like protein 4 [Liparis tanakae]|uniref:Fer-1-like protein 4 n=1 Tax=Liparis tanakae TaxID=230148 RepID=A0A4Z2FHC0_9TELE|nr:Fer-1-like protein 4 [Liparis tanakae]